MDVQIKASFGSVDLAERAISRLRSRLQDLKVQISGSYTGSHPADAPYTAAIYYPYQPINLPANTLNEADYELGGRVLFTADILGLPIYRDGEVTLTVTLDERQAGQARALLVNAGGREVQIR